MAKDRKHDVAGAAAGKAAAESVNPTEEERYWNENFKSRPYFQSGRDFDYYAPAYRYGWESASRMEYYGRRFEDIENDLATNWTRAQGNVRNQWSDVRSAARDAFERVQNRTSAGMTRASEKGDAMWDQIKGNWHQIKGSVKSKWNDLTDDEIDQMKGERERIIGKIQERYGEAKWRAADIERELRELRF